VDEALQRSKEVKPQRFGYLIHAKDWPRPRGLHQDQPLNPPTWLKEKEHWVTLTLTPEQVAVKLLALQKHRTQYGSSRRFLTSFVRMNELFELEPAYGAEERTP
jgi:LmbE family N-acetylglucosaminyl deacetylase